jgi:hypothetical protein
MGKSQGVMAGPKVPGDGGEGRHMAGSFITHSRFTRAWGLLLPVVVGLLCVHGLVMGSTCVNSVCFAEAEAVPDPVVSEAIEVKLEITRRVIPRVSGSSLIHVPTKPPEAPGAIDGAIIRFTDSCWAWQVTATDSSKMTSTKTTMILRTFKLSAPFISSSYVFTPQLLCFHSPALMLSFPM